MSFINSIINSSAAMIFLFYLPVFFMLFILFAFYMLVLHDWFWAPFHVTVYEQRGEKGLKVKKVYGRRRIDKRDGMKKVRLTKYRENIEWPELDNLIPINTRQDHLSLYRDDAGNFRTIKPLDVDEQLKKALALSVEDKDVSRWAQSERKDAHERLLKRDEHWLREYWPQIGLMAVFMMCVIGLLFMLHYTNKTIETTSSQAASVIKNEIEPFTAQIRMVMQFLSGDPNIVWPTTQPTAGNNTPQDSGGGGLGMFIPLPT